jgi:hypothetical protein
MIIMTDRSGELRIVTISRGIFRGQKHREDKQWKAGGMYADNNKGAAPKDCILPGSC